MMENVLAARHHLLYFVKYPEPGRVKTRLAASVGAREAARLYGELSCCTLTRLGQALGGTVSITVAYDPAHRARDVEAWLAGPYRYMAQEGGDLGGRLTDAFARTFFRGASRVVALGSDTIGLEPEGMIQAFDALERHDVVLGPARDGGYYLIGLARERPALFEGISWSSSSVLSETLDRAARAGLSHCLLPVLDDLDDQENLNVRGMSHEIIG